MTPTQKLYQLTIDVHTPVDNPGATFTEFSEAPEGWLWGQREPRRPGVYLWRYTHKWDPWFRKVVKLPSGELGTWSARWQKVVPLDHLIGKGHSSQWCLQNNQRQPKES